MILLPMQTLRQTHTIVLTVILPVWIATNVAIEDPAGGRKYGVDTHAIFFTRGIFQPLMETYANATVTLAVNRETGMVVVIE